MLCGDCKEFNRVTLEHIRDGVVVSGKITSDEKWLRALVDQVEPHDEHNLAAVAMIVYMERLIDFAMYEKALSDEADRHLSACFTWLSAIGHLLFSDEIESARKQYEAMKSGCFEYGDD